MDHGSTSTIVLFTQISCCAPRAILLTKRLETGLILSRSVADPGFSPGGAPTPKIAIIFQIFAENCMKMKEFGPPGGARVPGAPPPWIRQWRSYLLSRGRPWLLRNSNCLSTYNPAYPCPWNSAGYVMITVDHGSTNMIDPRKETDLWSVNDLHAWCIKFHLKHIHHPTRVGGKKQR